jgi:hypothetical protein
MKRKEKLQKDTRRGKRKKYVGVWREVGGLKRRRRRRGKEDGEIKKINKKKFPVLWMLSEQG